MQILRASELRLGYLHSQTLIRGAQRMILEPLFGLSLVLNVSLDMRIPAAIDSSAWMQMSIRQKNTALLPLVRQATDCIVQNVFSNSRYSAELRPDEINELIVDSMASCVRPVRAMIDARQRLGRSVPARALSRRFANCRAGTS